MPLRPIPFARRSLRLLIARLAGASTNLRAFAVELEGFIQANGIATSPLAADFANRFAGGTHSSASPVSRIAS